MDRLLVIDQDRAAMQQVGLACLERGVGVAFAETLGEGVRTLLATPISLIVVDRTLLRLTARDHVALFELVAPGVPVVVVVRPGTPVEARLPFELAGFQIRTRPIDVEDLIEKTVALATEYRRRS